MAFALVSLTIWSAIVYVLHRFVLRGLQPFSRLHAAYYQRPTALIFTPTILSATAIAALVFLPALCLAGQLRADALTLGVLTGYLANTFTHHAIHHWHTDNGWLKQRKHRHALHHHRIERPGHHVVTSAFEIKCSAVPAK